VDIEVGRRLGGDQLVRDPWVLRIWSARIVAGQAGCPRTHRAALARSGRAGLGRLAAGRPRPATRAPSVLRAELR